MKNTSLFGFGFLGIIVGCVAGIIISSIHTEGWFVQWKLLNSELKFQEIVDANSFEIFAKTFDGKLYFWRLDDYHCNESFKCNQWIEANDIKLSDARLGTELEMELKKSCSFGQFPLKEKPLLGNVMMCARTEQIWHESKKITLYALLDDGTIWSWAYYITYLDRLSFVFLGSIVGLISFGFYKFYRDWNNI